MNNYTKLLKNRNYILYLSSQTISVFSDALFKISITWTVIELSDTIAPLAVLLLISYIPQMLIGLIGGFLIDKFDRKNIMIISDLFSGLALFILFIIYIKIGISLYVIYAIRFILSLMDVFYEPAAMAYIPKIVTSKELISANSLSRIVRETMKIASVGVAGVLVAKVNLSAIMLLNVGTYIISAFLIAVIPVKGLADTHESTMHLDKKTITAGFSYIMRSPFITEFVILIFLSNIAYDIIYNLPSVYSRDVLHLGAEGYGFIQTALSLGAIMGTLVIGLINTRRIGILFSVCSFLAGILLILLGFNSSVYFAIALYFIFSMTDSLTIPCFTYFQLYVDDAIKGRVFAAFDTIVLFATPIASLIISITVDDFGVGKTYRYAGTFFIIITLLSISFSSFRKTDLRTIKG